MNWKWFVLAIFVISIVAASVILLHSRRQSREAAAQLSRLLQQQPDHSDAHRALAALLDGQRPEMAIEHAARAAELAPDHPHAWRVLGAMQARSRRPEAIGALRQALRVNPYSLETHAWLAEAYAAAGRIDSAIATAERALQLAMASGEEALADAIRTRLKEYRRAEF